MQNESQLNIGKEIDIATDLLMKAKFIFGDDELQYSKILQAKARLENILVRLDEDKAETEKIKEYKQNMRKRARKIDTSHETENNTID